MKQGPLLAAILIVPAMAGCMDGTDTDDGADDAPTILYEARDPWDDGNGGRLDELVVFQGSVKVDVCQGVEDGNLRNPPLTVASCGDLPIGDKPVIPEGTATLRWEGDASDSYTAGSWGPFIITPGQGSGMTVDEPTFSWDIPITPIEWDPYYSSTSIGWAGYWADDSGVVGLNGAITTTLTAIRDPNWTPEPVYDPWPSLDPSSVPQDGVMTLLHGTINPTRDALFANDGLNLTNPWPLGTNAVVAAIQWSIPDCPVDAECYVSLDLKIYDSWVPREEATITRYADDTDILVFEVPETLYQITTHQQAEWQAFVSGTIYTCNPTACRADSAWDGSADILIEAWRTDVDIDTVAQRLAEV